MALFPTIPQVQLPQPAQTTSAPTAATEVTTLHLPVNSVPAAPTIPALHNDTKGSPQPRVPSSAQKESVSEESMVALPDVTDELSNLTFSSPFLAQLLSQSNDEQASAIIQFYANDNTPSTTWNHGLINWFSDVKYQPSTTFRPIPEAVLVDPVPGSNTIFSVKENGSLRTTGVQAYMATFSRNFAYLGTPLVKEVELAS